MSFYQESYSATGPTGLAAAKQAAAEQGGEPEEWLFKSAEGLAAVELKGGEIAAVVTELAKREGTFLLAGLHGAGIDAAAVLLRRSEDAPLPLSTESNGGLFGKCEGYRLQFINGVLIDFEQIRRHHSDERLLIETVAE